MKCSELKILINKADKFISAFGLPDRMAPVLSPILDVAPNKTVAQLSKQLDSAEPMGNATASADLIHVSDRLVALTSLFAAFGKPTVAKDLAAFSGSINKHRASSIAAVVEALSQPTQRPKKTDLPPMPVRDEVVRQYFRRLEQSLGDEEGFMREYARLENDRDFQINELTSLAKLFANASVKSRPAALKKILARHKALMSSRAKAAATGGRIAG